MVKHANQAKAPDIKDAVLSRYGFDYRVKASCRGDIIWGKDQKPTKLQLKIADLALSSVTHDSVTIVGAKIYPTFNMVTIMGDGFPLVRFSIENGGKYIFISFLGTWRDNCKLQHAANPDCIPFILEVKEIKNQFKKIKI